MRCCLWRGREPSGPDPASGLTSKSLPFEIERALGRLSLLLEEARLLGHVSARLPVSGQQANTFRASLEREATRLATLRDRTLTGGALPSAPRRLEAAEAGGHSNGDAGLEVTGGHFCRIFCRSGPPSKLALAETEP